MFTLKTVNCKNILNYNGITMEFKNIVEELIVVNELKQIHKK